MDIKMNHYMKQASYTAAAGERASESHVGGKIESETKPDANRDTVSISIAGQQFFAEKMESRLKQLADPAASHKDEDMEKAEDACHSENGSSLIAKMTGRIQYDFKCE